MSSKIDLGELWKNYPWFVSFIVFYIITDLALPSFMDMGSSNSIFFALILRVGISFLVGAIAAIITAYLV